MANHNVFVFGKIQSFLETVREDYSSIDDAEIVNNKYHFVMIQYTGLEARYGGYARSMISQYDSQKDVIVLCYYNNDFVTLERTIKFLNESIIPCSKDYEKDLNIAALIGITDPLESEATRPVTIQEATEATTQIQKYSTIEVKHILSSTNKESLFTDENIFKHLSSQISRLGKSSTTNQKQNGNGCLLM